MASKIGFNYLRSQVHACGAATGCCQSTPGGSNAAMHAHDIPAALIVEWSVIDDRRCGDGRLDVRRVHIGGRVAGKLQMADAAPWGVASCMLARPAPAAWQRTTEWLSPRSGFC